MIKTYKCRKTYFSTVVTCDGKNQRIEFRGGNIGSGGSSPSIFKTDNEEIQKQIEQHEKYKNGLIWLDNAKVAPATSKKPNTVKTITADDTNTPPVDGNNTPPADDANKIIDENANLEDNPTQSGDNDNTNPSGDPNIGSEFPDNNNEDSGNNSELTIVPEITNFQKAKNYLLKAGAVISPTVKKDELKAIAKSMNVDFPNL